MSRITGTDAFNMMEAYNAVYAPQELTEEQVQEDFENWVNSLVEEGYDLSEYTWEDMYEEYLNEMGQPGARPTGQNSSVYTLPTTPGAGSAGGSGSGGRRGSGRDRNANQTSSSPGALRVQPTSAAAPYQSRFAGARDAAFARARQIQGSPVVGPRVAAPAAQAPARPSAAPARPSAAPARPSAAPTKPATASAAQSTTSTPAAPTRTFNPLMQRTFGYQTGNAPSQIAAASAGKPIPSGTALGSAANPEVRKKLNLPQKNLNQDLDLFDIVMGYLIDEGYADTEESALQIMANMSEEWREEILDEEVRGAKKGTIRSVIEKGGKSIKYVQSGGDIVAGDKAAAERASAAARVRSGKNRANAARAEQGRKKSIENLNAKPGEDEGDYDSGHYGAADRSDEKRHYSLSHTNRDARRRRASGR